MNNIYIIGGGFVGSACYLGLSKIDGYNFFVIDNNPECLLTKYIDPTFCSMSDIDDDENNVCIICLPTPMNKDTGECYTGIIENVIEQIRNSKRNISLVIKSTVAPGTTKRLNHTFDKVFFSPEFLTEINFLQDFVDLPYQIIGNPSNEKCLSLINLYKNGSKQNVIQGGNMILECDSTVAEMVKLTRNCYLATRLSFFNEIKQICDGLSISYDDMKELAGLDERVGRHYNRVPGPDGRPAWSKSCLPKDLNDLMFVAKSLGVDPKTMRGAWEKNLELRPDRDWELETKAAIEVKK